MILYTITIFLVLALFLRFNKRFAPEGLSVWTMPAAFVIKTVAGIIFIYMYSESNGELTEDAGNFIRDSKILQEVFFTSPADYLKFMTGIGETPELIQQHLGATTNWDMGVLSIINDNKNVVRLHSLIHFISFNQVMIHVMIFCLIALLGVQQLYVALKDRISLSPFLLFWGLMLIPNMLFWSSGVLKESVMLLGFALLLRSLLSEKLNKKSLFRGLLGTLLLFGFKPIVFIAFLPALLYFIFAHLLPKYRLIGAFGILILITATAFLVLPNQRERAIRLISQKQYDFKNVARGGIHGELNGSFYYFTPEQIHDLHIVNDSFTVLRPMDAELLKLGQMNKPVPVHLEADKDKFSIYFRNERCNGYLDITPINDSYSRLIKNIPEALINSLFRPFPNDPGSPLKYLAMLEVLLVFGLLIFAIIRRKKVNTEKQIIIITLAIFALCLSLVIGWTTPVPGAIVRYRIPVFLALLIIAGIMYNPSKKISNE